ncbi:MAG: hypothetical protein Q8O13_09945 [Candidatus Omnitrophota bacterium]|nr:hypothetical protein [Candidatus Omnitrophota bacterium]
MESTFAFVCALIILWALELRFKEYRKNQEEINKTAQDLKNRIEKIESDMVNLYLKKG